MIVGVGTDIVSVGRVREGIDRFGEKYPAKILADSEIADYHASNHPASLLAKRYAAKEAVAKAFGCGFSGGLSLKDIAVEHDKKGKPVVDCSGVAASIVKDLNVGAIHLSISDEVDYAVAFVVISCK